MAVRRKIELLESFETGHPEIDADHRVIADIINDDLEFESLPDRKGAGQKIASAPSPPRARLSNPRIMGKNRRDEERGKVVAADVEPDHPFGDRRQGRARRSPGGRSRA